MMNLISHILGLLGFVGLLVFCYNVWRLTVSVRTGKGRAAPEPPGAWPFIGHLHKFGRGMPMFQALGAMADKQGPVFMIRFGKHPTLVVSSYEAVKQCFTTNDRAFASRPRNSSGKLLGYNFAGFGFAPYGPLWREMRKLSVIGLFSKHRLDELKHVLLSELDLSIGDLYSVGMKGKWVQPVEVGMRRWLEELPFKVVLRMVAGKTGFVNGGHDDAESRRVVQSFRQFMHLLETLIVPSDAIPFIEWMDLRGHLKAMKCVARQLGACVQGWVEEHVLKLKSDPCSREDFIDVMLPVLKDDSVFGHTRESVIKATVVSLIVGGTTTTYTASSFLLSSLLKHRDVLDRVQEEIDAKVGRERWVEESDIENLVYLQAVVKETLRLYPPAPMLVPHEAIEDCNVCGYHIPKGTRLLVNVWKLHRDPGTWSDPEEFKPARFLTTHAGTNVFGQHFELIPFGSGRRRCPGIDMALKMLHLTAARLLQGFDITPSSSSWDALPNPNCPCKGLLPCMQSPLQVMIRPRLGR